ncbi:MAG: hypothetical protein GZ085_13530 [Sulfuriferula multivorans]|uniref:Uncharacterized protein n=1 Tax=Sulfuriferula multivorans TaxID=1559896 RepID=A0A7C9P9E5_9PROT|nr:hypothetical protein [Sulfuriferula multivorans]
MYSLAEKLASGIARLLPTGKPADDPLVSLKAATSWFEGLPAGDVYKSQQAINNELKRFNDTSTEFTKDRLAIFMLLDVKSRDLQDTLVRQYLRNPRMSRQVESQLWHAVYGLHWEIARGYHTFVLHITHEIGKTQQDASIPLITLRAIRAFGQLLKWRAIRYLSASEKLWFRLHNLYRIAEAHNFHGQLQRAYPDETPECSCQSAYLHTLMLDLANSGTLYPKQLDLLDRWLCLWHDQLKLDTQLDAEIHTFSIDMSADQGPRRVRKPDTEKPIRYWSTADLLTVVHALHHALKKGGTPAQLGLGDNARTAESIELLDYLQHQWASLEDREQRRAPRATIKRLVDVAHGLNAIFGQLKETDSPPRVSPYGTGLNYHEESDVRVYGFITERTRERVEPTQTRAVHAAINGSDIERWVIHDESECGFGAVVESSDKDWLRVGALIGIKSHESDMWQLGIVRRLSRINSDTSSVGIETLTETPSLISLQDAGTADYTVKVSVNNPPTLPNSGLILTDNKGNHTLILDPVHYLSGKVCQVNGATDLKLILLGKPIESSEGWIHVTTQPVEG